MVCPSVVHADIEAISGGDQHTMVLKTDGTVWSAGYNLYGQLGDGTNTDKNIFVQAAGLSGQQDIIVFATPLTVTQPSTHPPTHSGCAFMPSHPQPLALTFRPYPPNPISTHIPVHPLTYAPPHDPLRAMPMIVIAQSLSNVISASLVYADVRAISSGRDHNMVLKADGTVWTVGWNLYGQRGDGTNTDRITYVRAQDASGPITGQ